MITFRPDCISLITLASISIAQPALADAPITVVAAENFYGDLARQIGGTHVAVSSILSNPDEDPHLFSASPSIARNLADARLIIENGIDYDPWMDKLVAAATTPDRIVINVGALTGHVADDNPHLWYAPTTFPKVATEIAAQLSHVDPAHQQDYAKNLKIFLVSLDPLREKIAVLHDRLKGTPVTATEPVFGYMAEALGLEMRNNRFQIAIMNDTEPSISDVAAFEDDLTQRRVQILFYNVQVSDTTTSHLLGLAKAAHIPVVGVSETEPKDKTYQQWIGAELDAVDAALPPEAK